MSEVVRMLLITLVGGPVALAVGWTVIANLVKE